MGACGSNVKQDKDDQNSSRNNKSSSENKNLEGKIILKSEICSSWGFKLKERTVKKFADFLTEKNIEYDLKIEGADGGMNEYDIFQEVNGKKNYIFSNDDNHKEAVIADFLKPELFEQMLEKIKR